MKDPGPILQQPLPSHCLGKRPRHRPEIGVPVQPLAPPVPTSGVTARITGKVTEAVAEERKPRQAERAHEREKARALTGTMWEERARAGEAREI